MKRLTMSDIHAYLDGALDDGERRQFEDILITDPEAAGMVKQLRNQMAELRRLYDPVLDEPVPDRLLDLLRAYKESGTR
jgi:anti-sigma factor RsiW